MVSLVTIYRGLLPRTLILALPHQRVALLRPPHAQALKTHPNALTGGCGLFLFPSGLVHIWHLNWQEKLSLEAKNNFGKKAPLNIQLPLLTISFF